MNVAFIEKYKRNCIYLKTCLHYNYYKFYKSEMSVKIINEQDPRLLPSIYSVNSNEKVNVVHMAHETCRIQVLSFYSLPDIL